MDVVGIGIGSALIVGWFLWATVAACLRLNAWLIPLVFGMDLLVGLSRSPIAFLLWRLCFFYAVARLEPVRGLFRLPRWPRMNQRGRDGRRRREFSEPMPWQRGPGSY